MPILSIEDELDAEFLGNVIRSRFLVVGERLPGVALHLEGYARELPVELPVGLAEDVEEPCVSEGLEVLPTNCGPIERRPSHAERVHPKAFSELMRDERTVFSTAAWDDDIIGAIVAAKPVAQLCQLSSIRCMSPVLPLSLS